MRSNLFLERVVLGKLGPRLNFDLKSHANTRAATV